MNLNILSPIFFLMKNKQVLEIINLIGEKNFKNVHLSDIYDWDSLKHMNLVILLEKFLKKKLTGKEIKKYQKVSEITKVLNGKNSN